ncbi:MAG: class I SAM-dependent methyltransferase [Saprospiraceae bacterium]|nr:class I SAM-dependent methyltransferase [Saprospiraceae bacterium]
MMDWLIHKIKLLHPGYQKLILDYPVKLQPRFGDATGAHSMLDNIIRANSSQYAEILNCALEHRATFAGIKEAKDERSAQLPGWNNKFLPGLDIIILYTMLQVYKPATYLEVGSGNSTKVAKLAIRNGSLTTKLISIDPAPRAEIDQLADTIIRAPFESIDFLPYIQDLQANDILFIDNSHRILPNSDSMVFFLEVLPRLKPGVIVQIHDIYLPYDYPQFMCDRFYSEQYGLAMYLLANPQRYKTIMPNFFVYKTPELLEILNPIWNLPNMTGVEHHGGSFWIQIQ